MHPVSSDAVQKMLERKLDDLNNMMADADSHVEIKRSNIFDNIYSPLVIFSIFTLLGCVLGYINFVRTHRRRLRQYAAKRSVNQSDHAKGNDQQK